MLNSTGIKKDALGNAKQILANVDLQMSVGCVVAKTDGVTVGSKTIVKAGTPIQIDLNNLTAAAKKATGTVAMNAVLLHDVDVTNGNNNGTALLFGFVNTSRLDSDVKALVTTAQTAANISKLITFVKV